MTASKSRVIGNLQVQHLEGGTRRVDPKVDIGIVPEKPDSAHGAITMDTTDDEEVIRDTIVQRFSKQSRQPGFGFTRDSLRFQTFDNGDGTMTVVFDAG